MRALVSLGSGEDMLALTGLLRRLAFSNLEGKIVRVLERLPGHTVVEVKLETGRRNQIRLHAMNHGHPLLGERLYIPRMFRRLEWEPPRQALHAQKVTIVHPTRGHKITFESPLPPDLIALERKIRGV